jgi:hypothetical protein
LDLLIVALAVWQIVEILHHSELFVELRAWTESGITIFDRIVQCPWCLSVHVGLWAFILFHIPVLKLAIYAFAVSRLANVLNDLTHSFCRTPRQEVSDD